MSNTFKREMIARGVAGVVSELYGSLQAIVALSDEGIEGSEIELITYELSKRGISASDLIKVSEEFVNGFVARL